MTTTMLFEMALSTIQRGRPIDVIGGLAQFRMAQRIVRARRAEEWRRLLFWRTWR